MNTTVITSKPEVVHGKPCIDGTRIPVQSVLNCLRDGMLPYQIIKFCYPHITEEQIEACVQYAKENPWTLQ